MHHSAATILFSESQGRIVATVSPENAKKFEKLFGVVSLTKIGTVTKSKTLSLTSGRKKIAGIGLGRALDAYRSIFKTW